VSALALGRYLRTLLYEVAPGDPVTLATATAVLMITALAASYLPLRRALAADPMTSLRR
jgi:hypothetical protein